MTTTSGTPPRSTPEVAELEADPTRAGELAALDADVVDFLASTLRPAIAERLWATEDGRRSQRRAYLGATRTRHEHDTAGATAEPRRRRIATRRHAAHPDAVDAATETVTAADFYRPGHGHVFATIAALAAAGRPVGPVTVADQLGRRELLDAVGGTAALVSLQTATPSTTGAGRYARIVADHAALRRLIGVGGELAELGYGLPADVAGALETAESMVFDLVDRSNRNADSLAPVGQLLDEELVALEARVDDDALPGLATGFTDLDQLLLGLAPASLNLVAARPGAGKSGFALGVSLHVAGTLGRPVLYSSLEMSAAAIRKRVLGQVARLNTRKLRTGDLGTDGWARATHAAARLADAPLWIDDDSHTTIAGLRSKARRVTAASGDLALIVVDYVQLVASAAPRERRDLEVAEVTRGLNAIAKDFDVPVLALAQLNRSLESRADKRPVLADLRESGELENAADVVMFLYRDEMYNTDTKDRGLAEVIIAKHREGPTGTVRLAFLAGSARFADLARTV